MGYFAELNHNVSIAHVARVFAEIGIKLTKANGGTLPALEQVFLRRAFAKKLSQKIRRHRK